MPLRGAEEVNNETIRFNNFSAERSAGKEDRSDGQEDRTHCLRSFREHGQTVRKNTGNMRMCMLYYDNDCECIFFYKCDMTKRQF